MFAILFDAESAALVGLLGLIFWPLWALVIRRYERHLQNFKD